MAKRVSKKVAEVSQEKFQESFSLYALAAAEEKKMMAKMEAEIVKIREKYSEDLTNYAETQTQHFEIIQRYAEANKDALFTVKRSMELSHGTIGFRKGTPKVEMLPKWNTKKVLEMTMQLLPEYVEIKRKIKKDSIIADRNTEDVVLNLPKIGLYISQEDAFFIELKTEEQD